MTKLNERYKEQYEVVFQGDMGFARKMMSQVQEILRNAPLPHPIRDNEGTELNGKGSDLTIMPLQIGVRVRRNFALRWDEFTQDDKERQKMSCDIYFLGYADRDEERLVGYMVWDGTDYARLRGTGAIPRKSRTQNKKHSRVWFNGYSNRDIAKHCKVYAIAGRIAGRLDRL